MILFLLPNLPNSIIYYISIICSYFFFLQVMEKAKCIVPSLLVHGTNSWLLLLVILWYSLPVIIDSWRVESIVLNLSLWDRFYLSVENSVIYSSCVVTTMLWLLNVLVEVKSMVISLLWSAALVSLVYCNILRECCRLVDQGVLEGMHHQPSSDLPHLV